MRQILQIDRFSSMIINELSKFEFAPYVNFIKHSMYVNTSNNIAVQSTVVT